jgi:hypothetical protein
VLTVDDAATALLQAGLVYPEAITLGDLTISSEARRNRNLRVEQRDRGGYLLKQADPLAPAARDTIRCEAAFYRACEGIQQLEQVNRYLPRMISYDDEVGILALELLYPADSLWNVYRTSDPFAKSAQASSGVGRVLATVHQVFSYFGPDSATPLSFLRSRTPWILQVHRPNPAMLATLSAANYQTLSILQGERELCGQLDMSLQQWRPTTVIHGDIKGDNILWLPGSGLAAGGLVKVVDWEMVQWGDPAWDIAGFFQDLLLFWIGSLPMGDSIPEMVTRAPYRLGTLQTACRAFWRTYAGAIQEAGMVPRDLLSRSVLFCGARLIQSAYESAQISSVLPLQSVLALQLSANLLRDPESAQVQIIGIYED